MKVDYKNPFKWKALVPVYTGWDSTDVFIQITYTGQKKKKAKWFLYINIPFYQTNSEREQ